MVKKRICFVMDNNPEFLGGTAVYIQNLLKYIRINKLNKELDITCIYPGKANMEEMKDGIRFISIKSTLPYPLKFFPYAKKVARYLETNRQDIINSHAMAGYFMKYFKKENEKIVHTYHGTGYFFYNVHLNGTNLRKKVFAPLLIFLTKLFEEPPVYYSDKIIGVSNHIKKEVEFLYNLKIKNYLTILNGFDPDLFKLQDKREKLNNGLALLYVGRGGPLRKGLDRFVQLCKEISRQHKNVSVIIIGPEINGENRALIRRIKNNVEYLPIVNRNEIGKYYRKADIFFCLSRYEGGAPIFTLVEAISSGCLVVCSKDSNQEIIDENKNGIIIEKFDEGDAKKILKIFKNNGKREKIIGESKKILPKLTLNSWGDKYIRYLTK